MPTEGPLTDSGMEVWPRGIYDLVTQVSREYNHPVIEITESGCGYLDAPPTMTTDGYRTRAEFSGIARCSQSSHER